MLCLFLLSLLVCIPLSVPVTVREYESLLLRLEELENAVDKEVEETRDILDLIQNKPREDRSSHQACNGDAVGFHAQLTTSTVSVSSGDIIKFNNVITNVGEGYNSSTGIFTAPVSGYYEFIVTIMAQSGNEFISKLLINDSDIQCHAYGSSRYQAQGMCDMIYYVSQDSTAKVTSYSGSALYGGGFSTFSGHLIG